MQKKLVRILDWYDQRLFAKIIFRIVIVAPPGILGASALVPWLDDLLSDRGKTVLMLGVWPALFVPLDVWRGHAKNNLPLGQVHLMTLLKIIDRIVGEKLERFTSQHEAFELTKYIDVEGGVVFQEITQPDEQINRIMDAIWQYFNDTKSGREIDIKVGLARMGKKHIEEFCYFSPKDFGPKSTVQDLQSPYATFSVAKRKKKMVIIQDVRKEGKKKGKRAFFVTGDDRREDEGSMICYPVMHRRLGIPYVISVYASRSNEFKMVKDELYESVLSRFSQRITLEYTLKILKERSK